MAITATLVKELRERTGSGMMECKKALVETDGDIEAAYRQAAWRIEELVGRLEKPLEQLPYRAAGGITADQVVSSNMSREDHTLAVERAKQHIVAGDIIQVVLLVLGGLLIAFIAMNEISGGQGVVVGFGMMLDQVPEKFDMILSKDNPSYMSLPGISVLVGGMWVMNLSYWGFNQYIIQRALAAKSSREAQKGIAFAAFLKMLMPVLVVLPGIAAVILTPDLGTPDKAYPEVMKLLPVGIKGLVFAALIAAIVSSLASMMNSISTIFTMDIVAHHGNRTEHQLVNIGRITSLSALVIAVLVARPLLGQFDQAFQYIQEFTGLFTPGIVAIFLLAFFWKRTTANGALAAAIGSAAFSVACKVYWPALPFMDRVGLAFLFAMLLGMLVSQIGSKGDHPNAIDYASVDTSTSTGFNWATLVIILMLTGLYATWW